MTTKIHEDDRPSLPEASAYTRHADYILERQRREREWADAMRKIQRKELLFALLQPVLLTAMMIVYIIVIILFS